MILNRPTLIDEDNLERYSRHIKLKEIGIEGQKKIQSAKVLIIGAGGLGTPLIQYLSAAGIGEIGIIDNDTIELSNLQRQVIYKSKDLGLMKTKIAKEVANSINPNIKINTYPVRLNKKNIRNIFKNYNIIADGSDNFETRFLVNDTCYFEKKVLISAAVSQFDGHLSTFKSHKSGPCYRCLHPSQPSEDIWSCEQTGILGSLAGTIGTLQATEIIKEILNTGKSLSGTLLIYDGLETTIRTIKLLRDPECALCSKNPTILNSLI